MKKVLLSIVVFIIIASRITGQDKIGLLDSTVTYVNFIEDSLKKEKVIFEYDILDRIVSWVALKWVTEENNWINTNMQLREYPGGNKLIITHSVWDEDSLIWIPEYKYEEDYDDNGHQILEAHYFFVSSWNRFIPARKFESFYSGNLLKLEINYYPNSTMDGWAQSGKTEYSYNSSGEKNHEMHYRWNVTMDCWDLSSKSYFQYSSDSISRLINLISQKWEPDLNKWINIFKTKYDYDPNGNRTRIINSFWDQENEKWIYSRMEVDTFDQFSNHLCNTRLFWKQEEDSWAYDTQTENSYNSIGNLLMMVYRKWDDNIDSWQFIHKNHYGYDLNGNKTLEIRYEWDNSTGDWLPYQKEVREYLPSGDSFLLEVYRWSTEYGAWLGYRKFETIYNNSMFRMCELQYDWCENQWQKDRSKYFYYHPLSVRARASHNQTINIFPNPSFGLINITGLTQPTDIRIYSLQGQLLKITNQVENTIDISDLPKGVYILSLISGDEVVKKTIIIF